MADTPTPPEAKPKTPKGGGIARLIVIVLASAIGAGAGGFGAVIAAGKLGLGGGAPDAGHAAPAVVAAAPVEYLEIDTAFTSNLVDTGRYLQIRLSVSSTGGPEVVAAITRHKPALVSTVLSVLGECAENDVADRVSKDKLRARLKVAINETLRQKGVAPGIDEVFFTSLVVQ